MRFDHHSDSVARAGFGPVARGGDDPPPAELEKKLAALSDFDRQSRRTKQIMRGYAADCSCDGQGRVLLPAELREIAGITKQVTVLGQGNKIEIWDQATWQSEREQWLRDVADGVDTSSAALESLSL